MECCIASYLKRELLFKILIKHDMHSSGVLNLYLKKIPVNKIIFTEQFYFNVSQFVFHFTVTGGNARLTHSVQMADSF